MAKSKAKAGTGRGSDGSGRPRLDARPDTLDFRDLMYVPTLHEVPLRIPLADYRKSGVPILDQGKEGAWGVSMVRDRKRGSKARAVVQGDLLDTCFALLFLKRATFRVVGAIATEEGDDALDLSGAPSLEDAAFADVFQVVFDRWRRAAAEQRTALLSDFLRMGPRTIPQLVRRLEDEGVGGDQVVLAWHAVVLTNKRSSIARTPASRFELLVSDVIGPGGRARGRSGTRTRARAAPGRVRRTRVARSRRGDRAG